MKAIWVIENCKNSDNFYSKQLVFLLLASVTLWKRYHPNHDTLLYLDNETYNKFKETPIFSFFKTIITTQYSTTIDKSVFWSIPKSKVISEIDDSFVMIDHDFLIFKNIDEYLKDKVLYSYDEKTNGWYFGLTEKENLSLTYPIKQIVNKAANVSLLYFPDYKFANEYGKRVMLNSTEFSNMNIPKERCGNYCLLSEQLMLKQWLVERNIPHNTLSKNIWDCKEAKPSKTLNDRGIWNYKESILYYKHYGVEKIKLTNYDYLLRCINSGSIKINKDDKWLLNFK